MLNKNGEPDAMKVASPVRRGVHVPTIRKIGWPEPTLPMSALLWSTALSDINNPDYHVDFLTAIVLNLMLALSVLMTPTLVRGLFSTGVSGVASGLQNTLMAAAAMTPMGVAGKAKAIATLPVSKITSRSNNQDPPPNKPNQSQLQKAPVRKK